MKEIYTNWGPLTQTVDQASASRSCSISIGRLSLQERRVLEQIAEAEPVRDPRWNGHWDSRDWLRSVMWKAIEAGILDRKKVEEAMVILNVSLLVSFRL